MRIPNRNENGEYNKENLKPYERGWIECFEYLIEDGIDKITRNIIEFEEESATILQKIENEVISKFKDELKHWLDMEADEFNCSCIENTEE